MEDCVIIHHGIKGMRWGVRRYRNKDGTLTAEGKKRYNEDGTRKSHRQRLEERYISEKKSADQAKALAEKKIRTEKILAAVGGVTVAAAIAAAVHYRNKYVLDQIIPEDTLIKRITVDTNEAHLHDRAIYVTTKKRDQAKYVGLLGKIRTQQQQKIQALGVGKALPVNEISIRAKQAKVASKVSGEKAYKELLGSNKEFAKLVRQKGYGNYEKFNRRGLIDGSKESRRLQDIFYQTLSDKGYDGVIDLNDIKGGFKAKAPTILFGGQVKSNARDIIKSAAYREVPMAEIDKANNREVGILGARALGSGLLANPYVGGLAAAVAINRAKEWVNQPVKEQAEKERIAKRKAAAEKRAAQNSRIKSLAESKKYTNAEIAKMVGVSESRVQKLVAKK